MNKISCPVCAWTLDIAEPPEPPRVALANALGMSPETLAGLWSHQEAARVERELEKHLSTHPPTVWLPALMSARNYATDVPRADLEQAELDGRREGARSVLDGLEMHPTADWPQLVTRFREGLS